MKNQFKWLIPLIIILSLSGCEGKAKIKEIMEYAVNITKEGYCFNGLSWNMSREQVLKQKNLSDSSPELDLNSENKVSVKYQAVIGDIDTDMIIVYNFEEDKLISGQLVIDVKSEEEQKNICKQISEEAKEYMPEPEGQGLESFSDTDTAVMWIGKDKSYVTVDKPQSGDETNFLVGISVTSPIDRF